MNSLFQANIADRGILLDPRTKLFAMLTIVVFALGGMGTPAPEWLNVLISITPLVFLCSARQWGKALGCGAFYAAANLFLLNGTGSVNGAGKYLLIMLCTLIVRILPGMILNLWKQNGKTVVIAEHRLGWLSKAADRIILLQNGEITAEYGNADFFSKTAAELNGLGLRGIRDETDWLHGDTVFYPCDPAAPVSAETYQFCNFNFAYQEHKPVLKLDGLEIPKHAVVAVVGHNGAGKTTFSKCLCGLQKHFKGSIRCGDAVYKPKHLRTLCYMVMQDVNHQLFTDSVLEEIMLGMHEPDEAAALPDICNRQKESSKLEAVI